MKIENSKPIFSKEVERKFDKEGEDYNEKLMAEHSEVYEGIKKTSLENMKKELEELFGEEIAVKICDVLPVNRETIRTILLHFSDEIDEEEINKAFEIVKKYME